jgi:hypothetical protein
MKEAVLILLLALTVCTKQLLLLSKISPTLKKETAFIPRQNREIPMKARESRRVNREKNKSLKFFLPLHSPVPFYEHLQIKDVLYICEGYLPLTFTLSLNSPRTVLIVATLLSTPIP